MNGLTAGSAGRAAAAMAAIVAAGGLAGQVSISVANAAAKGDSVVSALWRLAGFYTIWTNVAVALVAGALWLFPRAVLARPAARLAVLPSILVVGAAYSLLLRGLVVEPERLQEIVSSVLHDMTPLLFLAAWWFAPHAGASWRAALWVLPLPAAYFAASLTRGLIGGWFPYWFLDPADVGAVGYAVSAMLLALSFVALGAIAVAADRWLARRPGAQRQPPGTVAQERS